MMDKLYEVLVAYQPAGVDLFKLGKVEIEEKISEIVSGGRHGKIYVIEIDTLHGTVLVNDPAKIACFYDKPQLADIVIEHNRLDRKSIGLKPEMTLYIERMTKELSF